MRRVSLCLVALAGAAALAGCQGSKPEPAKMPPPEVTVVRPASVPVTDYWLYNGYLETTKAVEVRSKIRGFLTGVMFAEGTEVTKGELLYTIDKREFDTANRKAAAELAKAEAEIKNWEAQIVQARAELSRVREASRSGAESKTALDTAQATYDVRVASRDAAIANRDAARAALHSTEIVLGYTEIPAKISGRISRTLVDEGNLVLADTTLMTTIVAVDELYVYFDAPEADLVAYHKSMALSAGKDAPARTMPVEVGVTGEDGYTHAGTIDFTENRVETATGTIRIRGRIKNPKDGAKGVRSLYPGMYARVRVPKSKPVPQLAIPEDCLLSGQEGRFLYVVDSTNAVKKRVVTVGAVVWKAPSEAGASAPGWSAINPRPKKSQEGQPPPRTRRDVKSVVAITAGLEPGDRVILEGMQKVKPDSPAAPEQWELKPPPAARP
jgi:RND family efflux transporter MFP subunit